MLCTVNMVWYLVKFKVKNAKALQSLYRHFKIYSQGKDARTNKILV